MSNKTKLKIGEFSKMMQVTVKTLRHYELKGLLLPDEVDKWTGYRSYSISQMQRLNTIRDLQRQGFTLEEIKELLDDGAHMPGVELLTQKIEETERQLQLLVERRRQLLRWLDSHKQKNTMEKFNTLKTSLETLLNNENTYKERIKSLEMANQNLFTKVTTNYNIETSQTKEEEYSPTLISKEYFEQLSEDEKENLRELEEEIYGN